MHNPDQAHELAMLAARFAGEHCAGHSDVSAKVATAYAAAYKVAMNIGEPKVSDLAAGLGSAAVGWAVNRPVFVHGDGRLHAYPEYVGQTGIQG